MSANLTLARLNVLVGVDADEFKKDMNRLGGQVQELGKTVTSTGVSLSKNLTAPIVAAGAAALGLAVRTGNLADEILDLSAKTGLTTDTIQEWRRVTNQAGVSQDTLSSAVDSFTRRLPGIAQGTNAASQALTDMGVQVTNTDGSLRSMDDMLPELISGLAGMDNQVERNALATQIFGRRASELAPILAMGSDEIDRLRGEAHSMGLVLSGESLVAANEFRQEWDSLRQELGAAVTQIGVDLIPIMQELAGWIRERGVPAVKSVVEWFGNLDASTLKVVGGIVGVVAAVGPLLIGLGKVITIGGTVIKVVGAITAAILTLNPVTLAIAGAIGGIVAIMVRFRREIATAVRSYLRNLGNAFQSVLDGANAMIRGFNRLREAVGLKAIPQLEADITGAFDRLADRVPFSANETERSVTESMETLGRNADAATSTMADNVVGNARTMKEGATGEAEAMQRDLSRIMEGTSLSVQGSVADMADTSLIKLEGLTDGAVSTTKTATDEIEEAWGRSTSEVMHDVDRMFDHLGIQFSVSELDRKLFGPMKTALELAETDWGTFASDVFDTIKGLWEDLRGIFNNIREAAQTSVPQPGMSQQGGQFGMGFQPPQEQRGGVSGFVDAVSGGVADILGTIFGRGGDIAGLAEQIVVVTVWQTEALMSRLDPIHDMINTLHELGPDQLTAIRDTRDNTGAMRSTLATMADAVADSIGTLSILPDDELRLEASMERVVDAVNMAATKVVGAIEETARWMTGELGNGTTGPEFRPATRASMVRSPVPAAVGGGGQFTAQDRAVLDALRSIISVNQSIERNTRRSANNAFSLDGISRGLADEVGEETRLSGEVP